LKDLTPAQLEVLSDKVRDAFGMLLAAGQFGERLETQYKAALGQK